MSTVPYDQFLKEVVPYVHDVPEFVAINAIRNACIEFCTRSLFLRKTLPSITIVAGTSQYPMFVTPGYFVASIISGAIGLHTVKPANTDDLNKIFGTGWPNLTGYPSYVTQLDDKNVTLALTPDQSYSDPLVLNVALRPTRDSTKIETAIYERWAEVIGMGARARLHDTPGQPYSDPEAARRFRAWFQEGYSRAAIEVNRSLVRSNERVEMPRFV